jgi:competence protein ComFC
VAIVEIHPQNIRGPWVEGFVLDQHVLSSQPIGYVGEHMQFETIRTPLGELVYQLKYRHGPLDDVVETAAAFVKERWSGCIDCVVPPPPSLHRTKQPALLIAGAVAKAIRATHLPNATVKASATQQMKNVPASERAPLLSAAIQLGPDLVRGKRVLLVDDLWETGSTLRRVADLLKGAGATEIRALAITRTK